jgi:inositol-phosphate phosphatase / L-galactose 1-phosphate phosphatase
MTEASPYQPQLELAKDAALKAGEIIRSYCSHGTGRSSKHVTVKSGVDLVTEADTRVEKMITGLIKDEFPNDLIIGEEDQADSPNGEQGDPFPTDSCWCVDPIDGTTNFVHNYPFVAVSIGYMDGGIPRVGVIYNPFTDSMYEAAEGSGAFLNGRRITIDRDASSVKDCLLVNNIGHYRYEDFVEESAERVKKWLKAGLRGYRASGSAAQNLAHVASGQVSCYYEHGYGGPWDVCAGMVLVREAGGVVWDARGNETDLEMRFGKGSVCAGGIAVVKDVLKVAGKPTFEFSGGK